MGQKIDLTQIKVKTFAERANEQEKGEPATLESPPEEVEGGSPQEETPPLKMHLETESYGGRVGLKTIPPSPLNQQYCPKCRKTLKQAVNFYKHRNGEYDEICRQCLTLRIDAWKPDTFLWLLERFDMPYIQGEWNILRDKMFAKDPYKFKNSAVFGKYLGKMRIKQFADKHWDDTADLAEQARIAAEQTGVGTDFGEDRLETMKLAYEKGEISEAQYRTFAETMAPSVLDRSYLSPDSREALAEKLGIDLSNNPNAVVEDGGKGGSLYPSNSDFAQVDLPDVGADLTEEDKVYLAMKWGRLYRLDEWVALEKMYKEFLSSFDIQGAARLDTLKKICKTSLKMDEAIDAGDVESYQKLSRVYDTLMKSARFTEAQNKEEKGDFVDSVGEIVLYCEQHGGKIPRYQIKTDYDILDKIIRDLKEYNKSLIYEDKALAMEIETYLKHRQIQDDMKRNREEKGNEDNELQDRDYGEFNQMIDLMRDFNHRIEHMNDDDEEEDDD